MLYSHMLYPCGAQRALVFFFCFFFRALSFNPSEESGWEEKRQRATEDGSLAVSLRGPYEISSHVLHHAHYILLFFCPALFISFPFSRIRSVEMMATFGYFFCCQIVGLVNEKIYLILSLSSCCMEITQRKEQYPSTGSSLEAYANINSALRGPGPV